MRILIVEDERMLADSVAAMLRNRGFDAEAVYDGRSGFESASRGGYDLVILDVMLPFMDGYQVAARLRETHVTVPILMLTARSSLDDRVEGLNAGADYYLTKPFEFRELLACVHALLRRQGDQAAEQLSCGGTSLDPGTNELICGGRRIRLSSREYDVMRLLMKAGRNNVSKETLLNRVWGYDSDALGNSVEAYVGFLRKKLRSIGSDVRIEVIRRVGYHLEAGEKDA